MIGCERISGAAANGNYLNPIQSARIRSINSVSFRYGKVEVRARLPRGDWLWYEHSVCFSSVSYVD